MWIVGIDHLGTKEGEINTFLEGCQPRQGPRGPYQDAQQEPEGATIAQCRERLCQPEDERDKGQVVSQPEGPRADENAIRRGGGLPE